MVGISPVRNSPTIRRRKHHTTLTARTATPTSPFSQHRCGILAFVVVLLLVCLWQTRTETPSNLRTAQWDVIVVGSGLAGLTTTLQVLDRGGRVALVEKEATLGGNSLKASSGMNACCDDHSSNNGDSLMAFEQDTTRSAGALARPSLIQELVASSAS